MKKMLICSILVLALISCGKKEEGKVLATIDSDKITVDEFSKELDKIPMNMKMMVATQSGKKAYLDNLVMKKLLLREAGKEKLEQDAEFKNKLADIKDQLLIEALLKKKLTTGAQASDDEAMKYYEANKDTFKKEQEIHTRHILVKTEEEAKQIQGKIAKGEDFVELAKQYSIEPNAKTTGGDIGPHPKGSLVPEYEAAAFKLTKPGQVSGIVKSKFGYHIIRLEGGKQAAYVPFEEAKEFIKQKLSQEKQREFVEKYIADLKKAAKITISDDLLKDEKPAEKPGAEPAKPEATSKDEGAAKPEKTEKKEAPQPKK